MGRYDSPIFLKYAVYSEMLNREALRHHKQSANCSPSVLLGCFLHTSSHRLLISSLSPLIYSSLPLGAPALGVLQSGWRTGVRFRFTSEDYSLEWISRCTISRVAADLGKRRWTRWLQEVVEPGGRVIEVELVEVQGFDLQSHQLLLWVFPA